jgi:hypothetical protein
MPELFAILWSPYNQCLGLEYRDLELWYR